MSGATKTVRRGFESSTWIAVNLCAFRICDRGKRHLFQRFRIAFADIESVEKAARDALGEVSFLGFPKASTRMRLDVEESNIKRFRKDTDAFAVVDPLRHGRLLPRLRRARGWRRAANLAILFQQCVAHAAKLQPPHSQLAAPGTGSRIESLRDVKAVDDVHKNADARRLSYCAVIL